MQLLRSLDSSVAPVPPPFSRRRLIEIAALAALGIAGLSARLVQLQIVEGDAHRDRADNNRLRATRVPASRGLIYDRNRIAMVRNQPSFTISVLPADLPRRPEVVYRRLARLIGGSAEAFARAVARSKGNPFTPVPIVSTPDPRAAHAIEERHLELPGVDVAVEPQREYVDGPLTSHLLGYVGQISQAELAAAGGDKGPYTPLARVGKNGVEAHFEAELRGTSGQKEAEVDATGREVALVSIEPPRPGRNVVLSIDLAFQREVHRILSERIAEFEVASVVVLDPTDGQVLAMVHLPAYDNSLFTPTLADEDFGRLMSDPARPMLNGAIASAWPPGSCFKIVTALAALQLGVVQPEQKIFCGGGIRLPSGASRKCWAAHGEQDVVSALANSCDTYFYTLGGGDPLGKFPGVGGDRLAAWAQLFGYGKPTGVELPGEVPGLTPTRAWKKATHKEDWYVADDWFSAIGQGFYLTTPIQMATMAAAVANGGTLHMPRLALRLTDQRGETVRTFGPATVGKLPIDDKLVQFVREGVRAGMLIGKSPFGASYTGTSWDSKIPEMPMAGKTSTAEYGTPGPDGKLPTHGWFSFWAPHEAPKIAGAVFVKRGRGAQEAAKVGRDVVKAYFGIV